MNIIDNIIKRNKKAECLHENVKWLDSLCMIAGYQKEGICLDCGAQLLKNTDGKVVLK